MDEVSEWSPFDRKRALGAWEERLWLVGNGFKRKVNEDQTWYISDMFWNASVRSLSVVSKEHRLIKV